MLTQARIMEIVLSMVAGAASALFKKAALAINAMALANMKKAAHAVVCKSGAINFKDSKRHSGNPRPARAQNLTKKS